MIRICLKDQTLIWLGVWQLLTSCYQKEKFQGFDKSRPIIEKDNILNKMLKKIKCFVSYEKCLL